MGQNIRSSIMVVYDQEKHIEVNYLIAFWKWLGIMVSERTFQSLPLLKEKLQQERNLFDCIFIIGTLPKQFSNYFNYSLPIHTKEIYSLKDDYTQIDEWIKKYSQIIFSCNQIDYFVDLYRKYNCYTVDLIIELNRLHKKLIKSEEDQKNENWKLIDKLNELIVEIKNFPEQDKESCPLLFCCNKYIEATSMHKVNLLCNELNYNNYYNPEIIIESLITITSLIPTFSPAYVKIADIMKTTQFRASVYPNFIKALKARPNNPYLSDTYLDIKRHRQDRMQCQDTMRYKDLNELISYCEKASELNPINYKAYFQYAGLMMDLKKIGTAMDNYEKTIDILNLLAPLSQLSPIELDYMLRSYALMGLIYYQYWSDALKKHCQIRKAQSIRKQYLENNLFSSYYFFDNPTYFKKKILTKTNYLD